VPSASSHRATSPCGGCQAGACAAATNAAPAATLAASILTLATGLAAVPLNAADDWALPTLFGLLVGLIVLLLYAYNRTRSIDPTLVVLIGCCVVAASVLGALPQYFSTLRLFAVIHRSVADAALLLAVGVPSASVSLRYLFGGTPRASDVARYPVLLVALTLGLGAYALLVVNLLARAWEQLSATTREGGPRMDCSYPRISRAGNTPSSRAVRPVEQLARQPRDDRSHATGSRSNRRRRRNLCERGRAGSTGTLRALLCDSAARNFGRLARLDRRGTCRREPWL
jgi:hypothetical protein